MRMRTKLLRLAVIGLIPLMISGCFNIVHFIDVGADGKVQVRWRMSISSALAEMGSMNEAPGEQSASLDDDLEEARAEIRESLKGIAEKVQVNKFENDQAQGIDIALTVKSLAGMQSEKLPENEMPIVPGYDAKKKQLVFRFTPESASKLKAPGGQGEGDEDAEMAEGEDADEGAEDQESMQGQEGMEGMEQLGEKLGQLFASSASYDIVVGSGFKVKEAYVRTAAGKRGAQIEVLELGSVSMIRFPLLGMFASPEFEEGFEIVVQMR